MIMLNPSWSDLYLKKFKDVTDNYLRHAPKNDDLASDGST